MARPTETPRLSHRANNLNSIANPPKTPLQAHTNFMEVRVHTAKCDSCEKHNKLTLYRCMDCGQHVCSLCWKKSGNKTHVFGGGFRNAPKLQPNNEIKSSSGESEKGHENPSRTRTRRRVHVISDDDGDDDDFQVLKPGSVIPNTEAIDTSKQQSKRTNAIMSGDQHQDREDNLPDLWPMVPARGFPVLRAAVPTSNTSATGSANPEMQKNAHIPGNANDPERQRDAHSRSQKSYVSVGDQETDFPVPYPSRSFVSNQLENRYAQLADRPNIYRPQLRSDPDEQAANPLNQLALSNVQFPNLQAPRLPQPSVRLQQASRQVQPAVYRPRPEADVNLQAVRSQLAFAPHRNNSIHQAPRPGPVSVLREPALRPSPRAAQPSVYISQKQVQTASNTDQVAARDQRRALYLSQLNEHAEAYANANNRQAYSSQQHGRPAANRDHLATHNQQALISNQLSSSFAGHEQMLAARDHQLAYLSRQQANRSNSGLAHTPVSQQRATNLSPPSQAFLSQMHAASLASRQSQEHSPEVIEAADALLSYAGVEQKPRDRFSFEQDPNRNSQLCPASQLESPSSARNESHSSTKALVSPSGAAGTQSTIGPRGLVRTPSPRNTDADSAKARLKKHQRSPAGLQSPSGARMNVSDYQASHRGHPRQHDATLQPGSAPTLTDSSTAMAHASSFRSDQSRPDSGHPMSQHAAAYLYQWDAGRAALTSSSNSTAVDVPVPQLEHPRSAVPTVNVRDNAAGGKEPGKVTEARVQMPTTPISVPEGPNDGDVIMGSPEVEDDGPRSSEVRIQETKPWIVIKDAEGENHPRIKNKDETDKEYKVVAAREKTTEGEHPNQINDDGKDVETTSWNKLEGNKLTVTHRGAEVEAKEIKFDRIIKRGVAHVKKPEPKARKGKLTLKYVG